MNKISAPSHPKKLPQELLWICMPVARMLWSSIIILGDSF